MALPPVNFLQGPPPADSGNRFFVVGEVEARTSSAADLVFSKSWSPPPEDLVSFAVQVEESLTNFPFVGLPTALTSQSFPPQGYETFDWPPLRKPTNTPELGNVHPNQEGANPESMFTEPLNTRKPRIFVSSIAQLIKYWDNDHNVGLDPDTLLSGSRKVVNWQCDVNPKHRWKKEVRLQKIAKNPCPFCKKDPEILLPPLSESELMIEWDHDTNSQNGLTPEQFTTRSKMRVWWKCSNNPNHPAWEAKIIDRAYGLKGCKTCRNEKKKSK